MELINNTTKTLKDDLSVEIKQGSKLSIAAACFSIYAFQELKEQLSQIEELRFIFTSPTFVTEKAKKERREFYIPRLTRERNLYGTEFEIKLRNELTQKAIARECAEWIRQKVTFKSNVSDKSIQGQIVVDGVGYTPINNFTTVELGCEKGNVISTTIVKDESLARTLFADFNEIWNDSKVLQVVTDEVIDSITAAYNENSPDFIYFVTLYNIFSEFLEDVSEDVLPNEATGFKESKIWGMLYNFQKDAALAIINKLEKYNGCILADSVGLGKTFTALAVIKYYENRNKSVLVLCPKKLTNNWNTYKDNYVNNPIAADRLRYDVLYHTDLNRTHGNSNGLDLSRLNWGNYDLVVIDESHNFRNGGKLIENPDEETKDNRYVTLMKKVIRAGVKTKVLMLSATPVNNRFNDLKNQLALAYEGHTDYIDEKLNTSRSIDEIFRNAQRAFNTWSKWEPCDRTTENLLKMLDFDFFELLDSVTIARSRKHIQKYYDTSAIGTFPTRLKPMFTDGHESKVKENPLNENFAKKEFQALWREINHKYAYTVEFDSAELIRKAIAHIDEKLFVSELQYTTTIGRQKANMNEYEIDRGDSFTGEKTRTQTLKHAETSQIKYDLIGKIADGAKLTRKSASAILQGIRADKLYMFKNNPEEFISKVIRLINEQKATMIVEHISYNTIEGEYDSSIFTAEKATQSFDKAFLAKKAIQDYVFTDGSADKSIERKFAEDLDAAEEVCVYAKLPRTFQIPTPVGNYSPDWAIAFYEGTVKHIFFVAETKGTMETLELRPIEQAKISCAKKLFNEMSTSHVVYHDVDSYQSLLNIMNSI